MRTKRGLCYPRVVDVCLGQRVVPVNDKKRRGFSSGEPKTTNRKKARFSPDVAGKSDLFDALPDDLVVSILCKLSSTARCPSDFVNVLITYAYLLFYFFSPFVTLSPKYVTDVCILIWMKKSQMQKNEWLSFELLSTV